VWPTEVLEFHRAWTAFKRAQGRRDFTDLIEMALLDVPAPPGDCRVLIVDEAQDLSALENALVRQWTRHTDQTVVAGDADQALYGWRGAEPTFFLPGAVPEDRVRVLHQSFRVPQAAHGVAVGIITPCEGRYPTEYRPTEKPGKVELGMAAEHARNPDLGSIMLIAPCGFQLFPLLAELRARGVPYCNPYRATHGAWNPLPRGRKDAVTFSERLEAFTVPSRLGRGWSQDEFTHWASQLTAEFLKRGVKSELKEGTLRAPRTVDELRAIFRNASDAERALAGDLDWFVSALSPAGKKSAEYPLRVVRAFGIPGITEKPRVIVGTIHSVKGGQADKVVVCPDMSRRGADELANNEDSIRRLFYVAVTRTMGDLMMTTPGGRLYANFW
jgi:DNA helicase-2/ATP-dependent DNA helicase PcrA